MNRIFDFIKVRRANARNRPGTVNPAPRGRRVFIALALALTVGSAGQTPPAQAAPAGATEIRFSMLARKLNGNATICVGDNVPIHVRVMRAEFVGNQGDNVQDLPGVFVEASMSNGGIGTLHPISIMTGWDSSRPGGADYKFHADKVGTTTISFKGTINHIWWPAKLGLPPLVDRKDFVNAQVDIKVEDCQYKVTAISHWNVRGVDYEALIVEAALTADAPGHYTGTATVYWIIRLSPGDPCPSVAASTNQADLTGVMDADGQQLVVDVAYHLWDTGWVYYIWDNLISKCRGASEEHVLYTPEPLTLSVPASGGSLTQSQALVHQIYAVLNLTGSAKISVVPVTSH